MGLDLNLFGSESEGRAVAEWRILLLNIGQLSTPLLIAENHKDLNKEKQRRQRWEESTFT